MAEGNKLVSRIGLIGSIASIAGLLGQLDVVPALAVLATAVQLPAWTIVAAVGLSMWLLPRAIGSAAGNANRHLSDQLQRTRDLEAENQELKAKIKTLEFSSQELAKTLARLRELQESLDAYQSLEAEIMGLLRSGGEYDLLEITQGTSACGVPDGRQRVLRAIEHLGAKIEGLGGFHKKYQLAPNAAAPADRQASLSGR